MSLNSEVLNPSPHLSFDRSTFDKSHSLKTTFNEGQLVPFMCEEVLPGDTFKIDLTSVVRMTTPVFPVMDNAFLDTYFFFVPSRLIWDHHKEFFGENNSEPWVQGTEYTIPQVQFLPEVSVGHYDYPCRPGDLADYLGYPCNYRQYKANALPLRAYYLIWNEWFRNQNLQYPVNIYKGDNDYDNGTELAGSFKFGIDLLPVGRMADYFSSALPQPQKGNSVNILLNGLAPVKTGLPFSVGATAPGMTFSNVGSESEYGSLLSFGPVDSTSHLADVHSRNLTSGNLNEDDPVPNNLYASLDAGTAGTINQLRQAFAVQRLLERDALGGTRYREMLLAHFGVTIADSTVQIPEFLGGNRTPINMSSVIQQSSTDAVSPQGNVSGYSFTGAQSGFLKSFDEHGYLFCVGCVRVDHSYGQGIHPMLTRLRRYDFYDPALSMIGMQPIFKKEIMFNTDTDDQAVFGYKNAWDEYRFGLNRVSGLFKPYQQPDDTWVDSPMSAWTYQDFYNDDVSLSDAWMREGTSNVQKTLAVEGQPQFFGDFHFNFSATRIMPLYGIPGLVDHN